MIKRKMMTLMSVVVVAALLLSGFALSTARGRADSVDLSLTQNSLTAGVVPGPPLNLVADQGPGFVWLWWNHPATNGDQLIKNYQIFRGATAGSETLLDTIHVGATQYSDPLTFSSLSLNGLNFYNDTTATAGSTFFYEVRAVSDAGNSSFSNEVSANPSLTGDAPNAPSATGTGMTYSAQINWTAATVVSGPPARFFYLYRNDSFFPEPIAASFGAGGYQDQVGFLAATIGEVNNYTVKAANTYGEGAGSYLHLFIGGTGTIPSAPLNLTALGLNKSVLLTWDRPLNPSSLGFDNYQIARSNSESGPFVAISNQSTTGLFGFEGFYFDSAVVNGQKYFYEVTAMRGTNVSTPSNVANATPNAFVFPFEVNTLNAYPGDGKILLIWSDAFNATGYQIWRGDASNAEALLTTVSPTSFYIDSTVTNGNPYFYKVIAVHLSTTSPPSPEASATPSTGNPPAAPSITCTPDSGGVTVYNPTTPVTSPIIGWKVYRGNSAGTENPVAIDNITSIQFDTAFDYTDTATVVDQNYYYEIAAVNLYGTSPLSNEASSFNSPTGDVPDPVTSISATGMTGGIQVTWSSPTYEGTAILLGYELVRNTSVGGWEAVTSPIIAVRGTTQYTDHSAMAGVTYQYRVLATNLYGDASAFSPAASASASAGTVASAPQSLVATSGTGFVLLSWLAPTSAGNPAFTMYEVFRSTTSGAYTTPLATVDEPTTTYNDTSAVTGTPYFYVVKAMNTAGLSPASNEVTGTATAPPTAASAPLGLHAESGGGFILLNWTAPTSAGNPAFTRYDIYRSTTSGEYGSPIGNVAAGTLVFNDTSPIIGTPYFYVVKAVNTAGSSPASNEVTGTAAVGPQLATAPQELDVVSGNGYANLTWMAPVNPGNPAFTRYDIWRGSTAADAVYLANVTASVLTYNDTTVVNGNTYVYLVKAINTVGSSLASNAASTTPGTVPGTPTGVTATAYRGYITLGWTAPSGNPVNYLVYRGTTSEGEASTPIATTTATSYQDNSVAGGTKYFYEIKANNTHGMSAASAEVNATALAITAPTAPQDLTVTAQVDKLVLTWTAPGDNGGAAITGYQIFKSTSGGTPALLTTVSGSTLSYTDTAVSENTNYTYFVKAVNSAGAGTQSNSQTAVPESAATTDNTALYVGVGVVVLVIILGVGYYFLRKPKTPKP